MNIKTLAYKIIGNNCRWVRKLYYKNHPNESLWGIVTTMSDQPKYTETEDDVTEFNKICDILEAADNV